MLKMAAPRMISSALLALEKTLLPARDKVVTATKAHVWSK